MTGGSGGSSEWVTRILVQLVIAGPLRVEELQERCESMSKRTFYLALKEAEESGLLVRVRKTRKNVLVKLTPRNSEIIKEYDHQRKFLGLYYTPPETASREPFSAGSKPRNNKELRQLIFNQAWLLAIASVSSVLLEKNLPVLGVEKELSDLVLQKHKQIMKDSLKEYGDDAILALEAWLAKHAKEIAPSPSLSNQ